jgi:outer membrane protein with beta-barrel domain
MKLARILAVCAAVLPAAWGQKWEVGGSVGGGFSSSVDISSPAGTASAKIQTGLVGSVWLGSYSTHSKWGGELRYDYQMGNLQLSQGSTQPTFAAHAQDIHYDFLWHFIGGESRVQPFVAFGAGIKIFDGTGTQVLYQPLSNIALLTQAQDLVPMASAGGGVKLKLAPHVMLRLDVHDYLTPFPKQVITPVTNKTQSWLQDFVPMAGLAFVF